ncbi:MAG: hypothetical protein EBR02_06270 [Alphaproteobacteria bacterium]|nr:hypothetical protein [Alphaproteobacteria bacterium]
MQSKPETIAKLSEKAEINEEKARGWEKLAIGAGIAWVAGIFLGVFSKKKLGFGGLTDDIGPIEKVVLGGVGVGGLGSIVNHKHSHAYRESIEEIEKMSVPQEVSSKNSAGWKEKLSSSETAPFSIKK